jgi:hypothetical protein
MGLLLEELESEQDSLKIAVVFAASDAVEQVMDFSLPQSMLD